MLYHLLGSYYKMLPNRRINSRVLICRENNLVAVTAHELVEVLGIKGDQRIEKTIPVQRMEIQNIQRRRNEMKLRNK